MSERTIILDKIQKKEQEIQTLEEKLRGAKIYVQALQDVLSALSREGDDSQVDAILRSGSSVAAAREAILRSGKPVNISELLAALGRGVTKEGRASLASSLAAYVRKGEIFTRPAPNTFGLIELGHTQEPLNTEPPAEFGKKSPADEDLDTEIPF